METVGKDGTELKGSGGRVANPGHIIEAGWFLIQYASEVLNHDSESKEEIIKLGIDISEWAFKAGWDSKYGGLLSFIDTGNEFSPMQLE